MGPRRLSPPGRREAAVQAVPQECHKMWKSSPLAPFLLCRVQSLSILYGPEKRGISAQPTLSKKESAFPSTGLNAASNE